MTKAPDIVSVQARAWRRRLQSPALRRGLTRAVQREIEALADERVGDAVDAELVRTTIRGWNPDILDSDALAGVVLAVNRRTVGRLRRRRGSLRSVVDPQVIADLQALLAAGGEPTPQAEQVLSTLMQQPFMRALFTDVVFTAIVSFYQRVNPLFGALTMRALEDQIKGFIRYFMPTLLQQATTFATSHANRRILADATRAFVERVLDQPLATYAREVPAAQRRHLHAVIRQAVTAPRLNAALRAAALAAFDDVYETIRERKVRQLIRLDVHAAWLAERTVAVLIPLLSRPHILRFLATEMTLAAAPKAARTTSRGDQL
jgi:hypothetical protein